MKDINFSIVESYRSSILKIIERFSNFVIIFSLIILFTQKILIIDPILNYFDLAILAYFLAEFIIKAKLLSLKVYFSNKSCQFDFLLLIISLIIVPFLSVDSVIYLRLFRLISVIRIFKIVPDGSHLISGLGRALKSSKAVLMLLFSLLCFFSLIGFILFSKTVPEYFGTPLLSLNTVFEIFTMENWGALPDSIDKTNNLFLYTAVNTYTIIVLIAGGFVALSLANAVFVDELVSDNNDDIKRELALIRKENNDIKELLEKINNK